MNEEIELKPCPFCGGKAYLEWCKGHLYKVECEECHATTAKYITPLEAQEEWNMRVDL